MEDEVEKKKIGIQLPRQANPEAVKIRYALELEALEPYAEIIEIDAASPEAVSYTHLTLPTKA